MFVDFGGFGFDQRRCSKRRIEETETIGGGIQRNETRRMEKDVEVTRTGEEGMQVLTNTVGGGIQRHETRRMEEDVEVARTGEEGM